MGETAVSDPASIRDELADIIYYMLKGNETTIFFTEQSASLWQAMNDSLKRDYPSLPAFPRSWQSEEDEKLLAKATYYGFHIFFQYKRRAEGSTRTRLYYDPLRSLPDRWLIVSRDDTQYRSYAFPLTQTQDSNIFQPHNKFGFPVLPPF